MSDAPKTVSAKPVRDFTDAGTERRFTKDKPVDLTEGEFANFEAAGLVVANTDPAAAPAKRS